jgi:mono/diheme cytochrome c family protein
LRGAPQLASPETFIAFVRKPVLPDGSRAVMPAFSPTRISDRQVRDLYEYIINVLQAPKRK